MKQRLRFMFSSACELVVLLGASILMLSACGGGGGTSSSSGSSSLGNGYATVIPTQTGSVSAVFASNGVGQEFFVMSRIGNSAGPTGSFVQAAGALTNLYNYALSGNPTVTQDIAGDANYTIGRWVWGTITNTSTSSVVDTMNGSMANAAWHYVLVNKLSALPTSGSKVCDTGTFTHPTYENGTSNTNVAVTAGRNATLSFSSASGASYSFTLDTTFGTTTHTLNFSNTNVGLGLVLIGNGFGTGVAGGYGSLSDGGGGTIRISGIYANYQNPGIGYYGTYSFLCH